MRGPKLLDLFFVRMHHYLTTATEHREFVSAHDKLREVVGQD